MEGGGNYVSMYTCKNENEEGGDCCGIAMEKKCDGCGSPESKCTCDQ